MPLVDDKGRVTADPWSDVADLDPVPPGKVILPLARLAAVAAERSGEGLGVRLGSDSRIDAILPLLDRIALIAIAFPKFRDGRGFTLARTLRERHGYKGEIRAVGHVLPDQFAAFLDCGFTTVRVPDGQPVERWAEALTPAGDGRPRPRAVQLFHRLAPRAPLGVS